MMQKFSSKLTDVVHLALALDYYNICEYDISQKKKDEFLKHIQVPNTEGKEAAAEGAGNKKCENVGAKGDNVASVPEQATKDKEKEIRRLIERDRIRRELEVGNHRFRNVLCHLVSLLHAVGLSTLRDDDNLRNIIVRFFARPLSYCSGALNRRTCCCIQFEVLLESSSPTPTEIESTVISFTALSNWIVSRVMDALKRTNKFSTAVLEHANECCPHPPA